MRITIITAGSTNTQELATVRQAGDWDQVRDELNDMLQELQAPDEDAYTAVVTDGGILVATFERLGPEDADFEAFDDFAEKVWEYVGGPCF